MDGDVELMHKFLSSSIWCILVEYVSSFLIYDFRSGSIKLISTLTAPTDYKKLFE